MLKKILKPYRLILASGSPRRHQFFKDLNLDFEVAQKPIEEIYPKHLEREAITDYLSKLKAEPFQNELKENTIIVTSDTIVWYKNEALGKPKSPQDAFYMLKSLSDATHEVISSVCFTTPDKQIVVNTSTKVTFKTLSDREIWFYINNFKPFDKAGAYGIQEWIGSIGITSIEGSYNNVVGLPTHLLYETLNAIAKEK
ncbi:MAG: septum formation protein Maf [Winogradskyella sp.]|uniref:Maf-like protein n=1 Tax=Winogradskyella sp. TaxID=1883156 RepID=UPI00180D5837|nr:Maf-like protein [Winogradskyella sp.]MBT8243856.1 septum formation protein Maf [Winogradskyella sp.]NNK22261.1 septum formation protein Maf [Winogradskyella sp.]